MKKINYLILAAMALTFAFCDKNENPIDNTENPSVSINPETLYAPTDYNLDMRDFAMAVNEAVNSNQSFRQLIKEEANKKFDGDFDVLLSNIIETEVDNYERNDNGTLMKAKGKTSVRDLLNSAFDAVQKKALTRNDMQLANRQRAPGLTLIDQLSSQYPALQIAVPFHAEQLENANYIPPVVFLPAEYDESNTEYLPAFTMDSLYNQPAKILPANAFIVISMNERMHVFQEYVTPPTPTTLTGLITDFGIDLTWNVSAETNTSNTLGYRIFRSTNLGSPIEIVTKAGCYNTSHRDADIEFNNSYQYYVVAYNSTQSSGISNKTNILSVTTLPAAATEFVAYPINMNTILMRWKFNNDNYNGNLHFYKRVYGSQVWNEPFKTLSLPVHETYDYNYNAGDEFEYKIERETAIGTSIATYDMVNMPYRNVSQKSSIYIKRIKCEDISAIESWWKGAPEYKVKILKAKSDGTTTEVDEKTIQCKNKKSNEWETFNYKITDEWKPGANSGNWYDTYSFYFVEYDGDFTADFKTLTAAAKVVQKYLTNNSDDDKKNDNNNGNGAGSPKRAPAWVGVAIEVVDALAANINNFIKNADDKLGLMYLTYYENPSKECEIVMAEGNNKKLWVEFSAQAN